MGFPYEFFVLVKRHSPPPIRTRRGQKMDGDGDDDDDDDDD